MERLSCSALLLIVAAAIFLVTGSSAMIKSCSDTQCETCSVDRTPAGSCVSQSGQSVKYECVAVHNITISTWNGEGCSGTPATTTSIGRSGACNSYSEGSFMATCGAAARLGGATNSTMFVLLATIVAFSSMLLS